MKALPRNLLLSCLASGALLLGAAQAQSATVAVDPSKNWQGYMNVFALPADGGGYIFGQPWGTQDLRALFTQTGLTLAPNVNAYNASDSFWVKPDGSGNKQMDANFYVEDLTLDGTTLTFSGDVLANTLVSPYTSVAFIKEFSPTYTLLQQQTVNLVGGSPFTVSLTSAEGNIVQYGFETIGPVANPATADALGAVQIAVVPEPGTAALLLVGLAGLLVRRKL